jgi:DNA-directed RNA polymerase beta subunit
MSQSATVREHTDEEDWLLTLSGRIIDHNHGIMDPVMSSYNNLILQTLPRMINELRPIVWSERNSSGQAMVITINLSLGNIQKPMFTDHQLLLPLQAQQLGRSYNARLLLDVEISIRETGTGDIPGRIHQADIHELCVGEIPVLVGSVLCHQPFNRQSGTNACYFVVNGQSKVVVSHPGGV